MKKIKVFSTWYDKEKTSRVIIVDPIGTDLRVGRFIGTLLFKCKWFFIMREC